MAPSFPAAERAGTTDAGGPQVVGGADDLKHKQALYHDWEAANYDTKFSISYDERCSAYARGRYTKVVPDTVPPPPRTLEVGAGTGFFLVNLAKAGLLGDELHATDISQGMLDVCERNAHEHGFEVRTRRGDAEALPYDDDEFDLVIGHAVLHHLPAPQRALEEMQRVLRPGGRLVVAGEPTYWGDRMADAVKRTTYRTLLALTALPGLRRYRRPPAGERYSDVDAAMAALEHEVDLWEFEPSEVERLARAAGLTDVRVVTEELVSNWSGWVFRTVEGVLEPGTLGLRWAMFGYRTYLTLNVLDERVLERLVPDRFFYNLILHGRKPPPVDGGA